MYPEYKVKFDEYENALYSISKFILESYIIRYIKREMVRVPQEEFHVMKLCHERYMADRNNNKVNREIVMYIMNTLKPTLNHIIKNHRVRVSEFINNFS